MNFENVLYNLYVESFYARLYISLPVKFLSFYEKIIDAQCFLFYIILSNYVRSILFCWDKLRDISQTRFHVCTKLHCCKKHVCEKETLSGQPNTYIIIIKILAK